MNKKKYDKLKEQYPEFISLDQLCRICRIAKRSGLYLIQHGTIPAIDTGRVTWRYKIAIDDVIVYLRRLEQVGGMIPPGAVTSRKKNREYRQLSNRKSFSQIVVHGHEGDIAEYFNFIYADCEDVLTATDVSDMTGLNKSTITKLLKDGFIKSLENGSKYLIPKQYLMDFVVTKKFIEAKTESEYFKKILGGFEIWKTAKSSQ